MEMKKKYSSPELDIIKIGLFSDVLVISDPASTVSQGSGSGLGPSSDPWGDDLP